MWISSSAGGCGRARSTSHILRLLHKYQSCPHPNSGFHPVPLQFMPQFPQQRTGTPAPPLLPRALPDLWWPYKLSLLLSFCYKQSGFPTQTSRCLIKKISTVTFTAFWKDNSLYMDMLPRLFSRNTEKMKTKDCPPNNTYLCAPAAGKEQTAGAHTHTRWGGGRLGTEIFRRHQPPQLPPSFSCTSAKTSSLLSFGVASLLRTSQREQKEGARAMGTKYPGT